MHFAVQNYIKKMTYTRVYDTFLFFLYVFFIPKALCWSLIRTVCR